MSSDIQQANKKYYVRFVPYGLLGQGESVNFPYKSYTYEELEKTLQMGISPSIYMEFQEESDEKEVRIIAAKKYDEEQTRIFNESLAERRKRDADIFRR